MVPHTIAVKAVFAPSPLHLDFKYIVAWSEQWWWKTIAPFRQYYFVDSAPLPDLILKAIDLILVALMIIGSVWSIATNRRMIAIVALLWGFAIYRTVYTVNPYFMWYLPPFMALGFLLAGAGISWIAVKNVFLSRLVGLTILAAYSMHLPFTLPLDRETQEKVENNVRSAVGRSLNQIMGPNDTVVLEPVGYMGWEARNKTTYDVPGLTSPKAFAAYKRGNYSMAGMIRELRPNFVVVRPLELVNLKQANAALLDQYRVVQTIEANPAPTLKHWGLSYVEFDDHFLILKRDEPGRG